MKTSFLCSIVYSCVKLCFRARCRSLWMIYSPRSSAQVVLYLWLSNTFSTCWMSRPCSTTSRTQRPSTSGKPTGNCPAAATTAYKEYGQICDAGCQKHVMGQHLVGCYMRESYCINTARISSRGGRISCSIEAHPHRTYGKLFYIPRSGRVQLLHQSMTYSEVLYVSSASLMLYQILISWFQYKHIFLLADS